MKNLLYVLDGREVVQAGCYLDWAAMMENPEARTVAQAKIRETDIFTYFLGINLGIPYGEIDFFETMVYGHGTFAITGRYPDYGSAEIGHFATVDRLLLEYQYQI